MKKHTPTEKAISELEWLFYQSDSEMGFHSTMAAFILASKYSTKHQDEVDLQSFIELSKNTTTAYDILAATGKNRNILRNYQQLSARNKVILEAYYEEKQYDSELAKEFGPGVGVIPLTKLGKKLQKNLLAFDSTDKIKKEFRSIKHGLQKEVTRLHNEAITAYVEIMKNNPKHC